MVFHSSMSRLLVTRCGQPHCQLPTPSNVDDALDGRTLALVDLSPMKGRPCDASALTHHPDLEPSRARTRAHDEPNRSSAGGGLQWRHIGLLPHVNSRPFPKSSTHGSEAAE